MTYPVTITVREPRNWPRRQVLQRGVSPEEARLAARRAIGSIALAKNLHRDARSFVWFDDARRDLQYAIRNFARTPAFSAIAIVTIAIGTPNGFQRPAPRRSCFPS